MIVILLPTTHCRPAAGDRGAPAPRRDAASFPGTTNQEQMHNESLAETNLGGRCQPVASTRAPATSRPWRSQSDQRRSGATRSGDAVCGRRQNSTRRGGNDSDRSLDPSDPAGGRGPDPISFAVAPTPPATTAKQVPIRTGPLSQRVPITAARGSPACVDTPEPAPDWDLFGQSSHRFKLDRRIAW